MKTQTKFKQTEIGKALFFLFITLSLLPLTYAEKELIINIQIIPQGVISTDYNVVGDIFSYNISLLNNNSESLEDNLTLEIIAPNNRSIAFSTQQYIFSQEGMQIINIPLIYYINLTKYGVEEIIPYINQSLNSIRIWPFDVSGEYQIRICSSDPQMKFKKLYSLANDNSIYQKYYYSSHCFDHYFSAMPEWQYKLFTEEKAAAEKVQEANQKLLDLNLQLEDATQIIKNATIVMLIVAIITLYVATTEEKDKRGKLYRFIKWVSRISVILLVLYIIYLILIFLGLIVVG